MTEADEDAAHQDVAQRLGLIQGGPDGGGRLLRFAGRNRIAVAAGLVVLLLAAWFFFFRGDGAVQYVSEPATRGDLRVTVTATGTVEPVTSVTVGSEVSGRVAEVLVDYNDPVKKGEVIAKIDTTSLENTVAKSKANLDDARATALQAEATEIEAAAKWKRYSALAKQNAISDLDRDTALADFKRAQANLASARAKVKSNEAQLASDETSLSKAIIVSPIDGVVISRDVEPGQTVAATFETPTLFVLADDLRHMELQVKVDEADVGEVRDGQAASFSVDAYPNRRFAARITSVRFASTTTNNVVSYVAILSVDNSDLALRPGMTATAEIVTAEKKDVLLVPNGALRFTPPDMKAPAAKTDDKGIVEKYVWTMKDGTPTAIPLRLGLTDGQHTEVLAGDVDVKTSLLTDVKTKGK